jgi:hypothetical protein
MAYLRELAVSSKKILGIFGECHGFTLSEETSQRLRPPLKWTA